MKILTKNKYFWCNFFKKVKLKCEIDGKISLYSQCNGCGFKKFPTIDKKELIGLLKYLI